MRRATGYVLGALACGALAALVPTDLSALFGTTYPVAVVASRGFTALAVAFAVAAAYHVVTSLVLTDEMDAGRRYRVESVLRLAALIVAGVGVLGVATDRWIPALVSLGVAGVAVSFALQQPLLSLVGWVYIVTEQPYAAGDRVQIEDAKGDVAEIDYLVTTLWEVDGDLVTSHQPSGRHVTVPNSVVLTSTVVNYSRREFPFVWNELPVQVAYETDLEFARQRLREITEDYLGDEMRRGVEAYRDERAETPLDTSVEDAPTVNVHQRESWVELRVRYLVDPTGMQDAQNDLYERVLDDFGDHPERVKFPVGRMR
ncbi:mechanosensitive ion channel family protein [Halobacterium litoreum]|uniref:Mechanosensitive ion channel family protein n=1 Tax=Halobacterium litoreum TaxID=2039234 RepID=A0ABD5NHS4_9EURY